MMEMKLQDYIQYYIGCGCLNTWFTPDHDAYNAGWILLGYRQDSRKPYLLGNETDETWTDSIKPILRRLEDMSKREAKYILKNYSFRSVDMPQDEWLFAINVAKRLSEQMDVANYLVKQGFDLFGLIDAGLAIDAKTIKQ